MFFKSKKEPLDGNYNPGVGLYEIISKLDHPTAVIHRDSYRNHKKQASSQIEPIVSLERKVDLSYPLHSYATGAQRTRQNRIFQALKKQITHQQSQFEQEFDSQVRQTIKKGKLCKLKKIPRNTNSSLNESASLCLGSQSTVSRKTSSLQYLKHPPKVQSLDSLELFLLRDKLQKVQDIPGPGSYELPSVFKLSESRVQPFCKQQGRTKHIDQDTSSVGVGQYNIQDSQIIKSVIRFDKYSKRASLFENMKNSPTYYDGSKNLIPNQTKVNLEFPIVFGSTSKR